MDRRTALMVVFATVCETLRREAELKAFADLPPAQQSIVWSGDLSLLKAPEEFRVVLGGDNGPKRYTITDGTDVVTFTPEELMAALLL